MIWLGIETSSMPLSIAVMRDEEVLVELNEAMHITHSQRAMSAIDEVCRLAQIQPKEIEAIAVSEGPGSYTGVRIGVTLAKTLAWTLNIPLVGVSSLQVLARNTMYADGIVFSYIDARRGAVYGGAFHIQAGEVISTVLEEQHLSMEQCIQQIQSYSQELKIFTVSASDAFDEVLREAFGERFYPVEKVFSVPRASQVIRLAQEKMSTTSVHTFVPEYLRMTEAETNWLKEQKSNE